MRFHPGVLLSICVFFFDETITLPKNHHTICGFVGKVGTLSLVLIFMGCWLARSPDLTPCDYFLRGYLTDKVYRNKLMNLQKEIIRQIEEITPQMLENVFANFFRQLNACRVIGEGHFQHLL